jgi:hypothetical protein
MSSANNSSAANSSFTVLVPSTIDPFNLDPTASCEALQAIGIYCVLLFVFSLLFNSILLFLIIRHREYKNSLNMHMCALVGLNLFGTITELPWIIISNLKCR